MKDIQANRFSMRIADCILTSVTIPATVLLFSVLSGCGFTVPIHLNPVIDPPPTINRVPLAVGVYYDPKFRATQHIEIVGGIPNVRPIGNASATLFDKIFPLLFESVVPVSNPPAVQPQPNLAGVIEVKIEGFDVGPPNPYGTGLRQSLWAEITYRFLIYSPEGAVIASWTTSGTGEIASKDLSYGNLYGPSTNLAMQNAAIGFMTRFREVPEVQQWLRRNGI